MATLSRFSKTKRSAPSTSRSDAPERAGGHHSHNTPARSTYPPAPTRHPIPGLAIAGYLFVPQRVPFKHQDHSREGCSVRHPRLQRIAKLRIVDVYRMPRDTIASNTMIAEMAADMIQGSAKSGGGSVENRAQVALIGPICELVRTVGGMRADHTKGGYSV